MRKLPHTAAEDLLELIMRRYERASTILTSNRPVEDWGKLLGDTAAVTALLTCLPEVDQRRRLLAPLAELGQVGPLLEWIHGLLLWRYLKHPACRRLASHPQVRPLLHDQPGWANFVGESTEGETSCSEH